MMIANLPKEMSGLGRERGKEGRKGGREEGRKGGREGGRGGREGGKEGGEAEYYHRTGCVSHNLLPAEYGK